MFDIVNNWENYEFYWNGRQIADIYEVEINGETFRTRKKHIHNTVYDHGHEYEVESYSYDIKTTLAGITVSLDIRDFPKDKVKLTRFKYLRS